MLLPALVAGILVSGGATAQDYIDLEAERAGERGERPEGTGSDTDPSGGVRSYSMEGEPAATAAQPPPAARSDTRGDLGRLFVQMQQLQQEVMRLNGIVEEQANEIRALREQSLERYLDLDKRLAALSGGGATGDETPATGAEVAIRASPAEAEAYRSAYELVRDQQFDAAVAAFRNFLRNYPTGKYAPNAHYWLGELYLVVRPPEPEKSRQAFTLLLEEYPDNNKVPDALYKLGKVHFTQGNRGKGREYLDRLIREYGDSGHAAVDLAREFIEENY